MIGSLGAHLELLERVADSLIPRFDITWITSPGAKADSLVERGQTVRLVPRLDRRSLNARNAIEIAKLALRERPRLVITSGAGLAVPFCITARANGAKIVYVELTARVVTASATGRALRPFCDAFLVQWPELSDIYAGAEVCRPALLDGVVEVGSNVGTGTFVTLGSHDQPFHRLLAAVTGAAAEGVLPAPVAVQLGQTPPAIDSVLAEQIAYIPPAEFQRRMLSASVIVCHGGDGAMSAALRAGKRPIVMARRRKLGEHVDDHQTELVEKFRSLGLVEVVSDEITRSHIGAAHEHATMPRQVLDFPPLGEAMFRVTQSLAVSG
jgi:UDP-N-acetylglucosamine transferase subunit ALG13